MFQITYLSDDDRKRLQSITKSLTSAGTAEEQAKLRAEYAEIESHAKPLQDCNTEECTDLRKQLFEKFEKLNRIGRYSHAIHFKRMLVQVEQRQRQIHREELLKEAERVKKKMEEKDKSLVEQIKASDEESPRKTKRTARRSRWTSGVGDLD